MAASESPLLQSFRLSNSSCSFSTPWHALIPFCPRALSLRSTALKFLGAKASQTSFNTFNASSSGRPAIISAKFASHTEGNPDSASAKTAAACSEKLLFVSEMRLKSLNFSVAFATRAAAFSASTISLPSSNTKQSPTSAGSSLLSGWPTNSILIRATFTMPPNSSMNASSGISSSAQSSSSLSSISPSASALDSRATFTDSISSSDR
mmetsp:Transcript_25466/g.33253  ORF Transcript_25466/g.33253 Transcript_25466/m.33253 type:complete len:208 (+) Transcript_25466:79-702(+)